jgi:hypothetical protein
MRYKFLARWGKEQQTGRDKSGITFAVDAVDPADQPLWTEMLADSLVRRFQRKIVALPGGQELVINQVVDSLVRRGLRPDPFKATAGTRCHPLIDAVHVAFSQHRPLTLSPDAIWLVIAQGFGHHVAENMEVLRGRLVRHERRRTLVAAVHDLTLVSFERAIGDFSSQIRDATDPVLHETLVSDFSTTTSATRTASEVALMDTFSSYFEYILMCICGIPKITLEGTPDDWRRIRARVEVLATYDLEWWVSRLRPIFDQFVATAEGHPKKEFWQAIYKPVQAYGAEVATGWITDLFPYLGDAPRRGRNHVLEQARKDWALPMRVGVGTKAFPSGLSSAPVKVQCVDGSSADLDLVAGFFGVRQNVADLALSPAIGWCVTEPPPKTPVPVHP